MRDSRLGGREGIGKVMVDGDRRPYLVGHGTVDAFGRHRHSVILRDAAEDAELDVEYLSVDGADHNSILFTHPRSADTIADFFERTLGVAGAAEAELGANE